MLLVTVPLLKSIQKPRTGGGWGGQYLRALWVTMLSLFLLVGVVSRVSAQKKTVPEYELKAAVMCKILNFIDWPQQAFKGDDSPLVLCILGKDPFGSQLDLYQGRQAGGRRLEIRRSVNPEDLNGCHAVFISVADNNASADVLARIKPAGILTFSDTQGFCKRGGMINLVLKQSRISFEINVGAAERAGLKVSSKLLRLATIVETQN